MNSGANRSAAWREKRESEGMAQTQVWLPKNLRIEIDAMIQSGQFRNRSEVVTEAVRNMIEGDQAM